MMAAAAGDELAAVINALPCMEPPQGPFMR